MFFRRARSEGAGAMVAPFPEDSKYFGDAGKQSMVNFRARDLPVIWTQ
jgi:hypothetical protein